MQMNDDPALGPELDPVAAAEAEAAALAARQAHIEHLGHSLHADLQQRKTLRRSLETEWVNAEYAYEGVYTPTQEKEIVGTKVFVNITRSKTNAFHAHISDMMMPGGDDRCWGVEASPKPILAQTTGDKTPVGKTPEGATVHMGDIAAGITEEAKKRAKAMQTQCDDQLSQCGYNAQFRKALFYGAKYGTVIMRGPTKAATVRMQWVQLSGATYVQKPVEGDDSPTYEAVNPFHFYPESFARSLEQSESNFETFFLTGAHLRKMAKAGFDKQVLSEVLKAEEKIGTPPDWFTRVAGIANASNYGTDGQASLEIVRGLYEVWLCTKELSGADLIALFPDADPEIDSMPVSIWGIGHRIIKAEFRPIDGPMYSVMQFIEAETSLFGHGIPWAGANAQESLNAAWRMVIDNGAASAIPSVAAVKSRIQPADGNWSFTPGKTWYIKSAGPDGDDIEPDVRKLIQFLDHPVKLDQLLAILKTAKEMFDEEVAFSLVMQGETGPYTPETASATNTHYNSGRIVLRRVVSNIDDKITVPNIQRLVDWNMMFSDDESIKGDVMPIAKGSTVLMARMEQLQAIAGNKDILFNPQFRHKIDSDKVLDIFMANMRMTDALRSEEETKKIAAEMQQQAQHGQQAGDPARMMMAEVAAGRLQLDAQIHKDDLGIETGRLQIAMKELGITESDVLTRLGIDQAKVGLHKAELDSSNQKFNTESAMKMRTGQGI